VDTINKTEIDQDLDFIINKTRQLFSLIKKEQYHLVDTKELVRQQLINQFFSDYSPEQIATVGEKFEQLVALSTTLTQQCEVDFSQMKQEILKIKQVGKINKAYR